MVMSGLWGCYWLSLTLMSSQLTSQETLHGLSLLPMGITESPRFYAINRHVRARDKLVGFVWDFVS